MMRAIPERTPVPLKTRSIPKRGQELMARVSKKQDGKEIDGKEETECRVHEARDAG
jgi:hypothetical protein